MAVSALMASPLAKGLFIRAIGQSGALFPSPARALQRLPQAERDGVEFAGRLGAKSATELRALRAEAIMAAEPGVRFFPIVDGWFLPKPVAEIFAAGEQADVPLMAGWNKDEGFNFALSHLHPANAGRPYANIVRGMLGERAEEALRHYPHGSPERDAASGRDLGGDLIIAHSTWAWIEAQRASGKAPLWRFRFDRAPLTPQGWFGERDTREAGAFHAGELLYVFDTLDAFPWIIEGEDRELAKLTTGYWLNFVKTGDPNGPSLPSWPSYRAPGEPVLHLDHPPAVRPETGRERHVFLRDAARAE